MIYTNKSPRLKQGFNPILWFIFMKNVVKLILLVLVISFVTENPTNAQNNVDNSGSPQEEQQTKIKRIAIVNSKILSEEELNLIDRTWQGKPLNTNTLNKIVEEINLIYAEKGYTTSGVILSSFSTSLGLIVLREIEGEIEKVEITGLKTLSENYILSRLQRGISKPYNANQLNETLNWLKLDRAIDTISADLQPGSQLGKNVLLVNLEEAKTIFGNLTIKNDYPPTIGTVNRGIQIEKLNLITSGDRLAVQYTNSEGSNNGNFNYSLPLNAKNTRFFSACGTGIADIIEANISQLNIDSDSRFCFVALSHPIYETSSEGLYIGSSTGFQNTETSLLDEDFRLSEGADPRGRTRIRPLRIYQAWLRRSTSDFFFISNRLNFGLPVFGGTINNDDTPDSRFYYYSNDFQYLRLLFDDSSILLRGRLQLSPISLPSAEQFSLTSFDRGVRGYRDSLIFADSGVYLSAETRLPLFKIDNWNTVVQVAPFVDFATGWNADNVELDPSTVSSLGLGLIWETSDRISAGVYYAYPLVEIDGEQNSLQERGLNFFINWQVFSR